MFWAHVWDVGLFGQIVCRGGLLGSDQLVSWIVGKFGRCGVREAGLFGMRPSAGRLVGSRASGYSCS